MVSHDGLQPLHGNFFSSWPGDAREEVPQRLKSLRGNQQKVSGSEGLRAFVEQQVPPLRCPGFPGEICVIGEVRASLFSESRIRGRCWDLRGRKSGSALSKNTFPQPEKEPQISPLRFAPVEMTSSWVNRSSGFFIHLGGPSGP
jgi:hypothetical protein